PGGRAGLGRGKSCGLFGALSVTLRVADLGLGSPAVNVTSISQVLPAPTVWPLQLSVGFANAVGLVPPNETAVILSGALPVLWTMIACGLLVVPSAVLNAVLPVML